MRPSNPETQLLGIYVDLLVDMPTGSSLLDVGRLSMDLQDLLGYKVDVVEPEGLHW